MPRRPATVASRGRLWGRGAIARPPPSSPPCRATRRMRGGLSVLLGPPRRQRIRLERARK
eukprot:4172425-Pyramimonas_sp.AAC.1